jgi:hypothetical protein
VVKSSGHEPGSWASSSLRSTKPGRAADPVQMEAGGLHGHVISVMTNSR